MIRFSANLGFLWADLPVDAAIRTAAAHGFAAVELHWPYDAPAARVRAVLAETGLPLLGINTVRGDPGGFGLSALPGRAVDARAAVDQAIEFAEGTGAQAIHVMAGTATGPAAMEAFCATLEYACAQTDRTILIEPLNPHDAPGYFLSDTQQAVVVLDRVGAPNLKIMFDCYHIARSEGDVLGRLSALWPRIGHIQFAGMPDRGQPDQGTLDYRAVFAAIRDHGWTRPLGAEFRPQGAVEDSLDWMQTLLP